MASFVLDGFILRTNSTQCDSDQHGASIATIVFAILALLITTPHPKSSTLQHIIGGIWLYPIVFDLAYGGTVLDFCRHHEPFTYHVWNMAIANLILSGIAWFITLCFFVHFMWFVCTDAKITTEYISKFEPNKPVPKVTPIDSKSQQ